MRKVIAFLLLSVIFTSCIPLKQQVYFQGEPGDNDTLRKIQDEPYRLQVNDMLDIQIKSSDDKLDKSHSVIAIKITNPDDLSSG